MNAVYTPAGMEGWFREVCAPVDDPSRPPPVTDELIERMLEAGHAKRRVGRLIADPRAASMGREVAPGVSALSCRPQSGQRPVRAEEEHGADEADDGVHERDTELHADREGD